MKNIFRILMALAILSAFIQSCNRYRSPRSRDAIQDRRTAGESHYNLMGFSGDDSVITADVPAADDSVREESDQVAFPDRESENDQSSVRFSVQLFASKSSDEAARFMNRVEPLFDEKVMTDYKAPYYKVRVGEESTLEDGEALLEKVRQLGFPNAWLVRVRY